MVKCSWKHADRNVDAAMPFNSEEELFYDTLFRQRRKHGVYRLIDAPRIEGSLADTHCHTHLLPNPALAFARCAAHNVDFVCNVVDVVEDNPQTYDNVHAWLGRAKEVLKNIAPECDNPATEVCFAFGCHPHNAKDFNANAVQRLRDACGKSDVRAIGEIGLDFHYDFSPRVVQEEVFRQQLRLAHELKLPVVLHIREAHERALSILCEEGFPEAGVLLHCCSLNADALEPWLEHDCYIGFGGVLTFKKSNDVREAAKNVPLNRLLTETDAPYMTPEPMRGITCWADHVMFTADALARVRGCETEQQRARFFQALHDNALRFYGLI